MNNSTTALDQGWRALPMYMIWILQGALISSGNLLIVFGIARYAALRGSKEYVFMLGLSFADAINMAGYFFAGIRRSMLVFDGVHDERLNVWYCLTTLHASLWSVGHQLACIMLLVVSIDRMLCVLFPLSYLGWTDFYARRFVGGVYIATICSSIYMFVCAYGSVATVPASCVVGMVLQATLPTHIYWYFAHSPQIYAVASVVVYVFVIVIYKRTNMEAPGVQPTQQYELKRQRKVTMSLGMSAFCTLVLNVIPFSLGQYALTGLESYTLAVAGWTTSNLNPLANVFIYPLRHREITQALKAMFACQHMPVDLKMWSTHPNIRTPQWAKSARVVPMDNVVAVEDKV